MLHNTLYYILHLKSGRIISGIEDSSFFKVMSLKLPGLMLSTLKAPPGQLVGRCFTLVLCSISEVLHSAVNGTETCEGYPSAPR